MSSFWESLFGTPDSDAANRNAGYRGSPYKANNLGASDWHYQEGVNRRLAEQEQERRERERQAERERRDREREEEQRRMRQLEEDQRRRNNGNSW